VKLPERAFDNLFPFGAEVNIAYRCTFFPLKTSISLIVTLMSQMFLKLNDGVCVCVCLCACVCLCLCACACVLCMLVCFVCVLLSVCVRVCDIPSFRECIGRKMYRIYIFIGRSRHYWSKRR